MDKTILSRKQFILKKIKEAENNILLEEKLIALENQSMKMLCNGVDINLIDVNINKDSLTLNNVNIKNIDTKKIDTKESKELVREYNKEKYISKRDKEADVDFFNSIKEKLDSIPESNGCRYYKKINVTIGIIADEFLMNSYKGVADFVYITHSNYKLYEDKLDVLFIASAWRGLNEEWKGLANPASNKRNKVFEIIEFYKKKNTKVVFYSKEDPVNYDRFIGIAKECEYIFTTCKEKIESYKKDCNNENVECLEFSVNPLYHNPIGSRMFKKRNEVIFSGSWYEKYPHRIEDMKMIFDGVVDSNLGLKLIDRNYSLNLEQHFFPEKYLKYISPSISHEYLQKVHKLFNWAINFNSIKDSYTMFANRIYELQAIGNALLSNYSVGVNNLFPNVFLINEKNEVKEILNNLSDKEVYEHQVAGIRRVMSSETAYDRIQEMLSKIGVNYNVEERKVLVIVNNITNKIKKMFDKQSFENKSIIESKDFNDNILSKYDIVAFFDENISYGRYYIEDMVNAFKYTDSDYITKDSYLNGDNIEDGIQHNYVNIIKDKNKTLFWAKSFNAKQLKSFKGTFNLNNGYSIDPFEVNIKDVYKEKSDKKYKLSIIIPTYNNGNHLLNKCFNSLKKSSIFNDMEIIIVDDGSTNVNTINIVKNIEEKYSNVITYFFNDGGSGSASRPRNKGVEIATTEYITFLDPDNEAVNDGYRKLYDVLISNDVDMVIGNMLKVDLKPVMLNYYNTMILYNDKKDILSGDKRKYLMDTKFKGMSIQALLVKRDIIEKNNLEQVIGAVGQDTLFFYELLLNCNKVKAINETIHIYYAAVEGSTVNNISKRYFEKAYKIEMAKYKFFKNNNLLKNYLEKRYEFYYKNWYMAKLDKCKDEEKEECRSIVRDLFKIYEKDIVLNDLEIKKFLQNTR
ncbi:MULTISPECIES: glycosyltransferase [Clostridium]|uniref:Glycosyltransferase n=1 Tax=Clostridium tertium TaxID=1559 RepID=A0A9X3XKN0_9CLOT|nr:MULTISPECIES: glycosyltransferase [Clostridium]MDC4240151.1 glycosyltransferase [Clostridium tertium]MDU2460617.1 glycosyltransferase [Clostridium sp.]MDU7363206.1 glycosyltransferase [Clostridium sp.]